MSKNLAQTIRGYQGRRTVRQRAEIRIRQAYLASAAFAEPLDLRDESGTPAPSPALIRRRCLAIRAAYTTACEEGSQ